jgi:hypothetical protein
MCAKRGKICSGESTAVEDNQRVYVAVGRVVIVNGRNKLNGRAVPLFEFEHGRDGQGSQVKVFVAILPPGVRADDNSVVVPAFLGCRINHLVGGLFGKVAIKAEEVTCDFFPLPVAPVGNVAEGGFGASPVPSFLLAAIIGFDNQTRLPPLAMFPLVS